MPRGVIRNRAYAQQLRDFSGLQWSLIGPSDIDAFVEFKDRVYIFVEAKHNGVEPSRGQLLALTRLVDVVGDSRDALLILAAHYEEGDIDLGVATVTRYRTKRRWHKPIFDIKVRALMDKFIAHCDLNAKVRAV